MIFEGIDQFRTSGFAPKVIVIGSGPAGITVARKLAAAGIRTAILEAGSADITDESQQFYRGEVVGDPYFDLEIDRLRYLGGCSNHWAGWCRVLDAIDFEPKSWVSDTGWPIRRTDIEPYLDEVREILDLVPFRPDQPVNDEIRWVQLIKSPAVRFGEKFRDEIEKSDMIALVLNTYVTHLVGDGEQVTSAQLWSDGAERGGLSADCYIPCVGGLENSRLLLWSNVKSSGGVVPQADALGKYWMEHIHFEGGDAVLASMDEFRTDEDHEAFFSPTLKAMEDRGILNFGIRLVESPYPGVKGIVADLACYAPESAEWVAYQLDLHLRCAAQLHMAWEQAPLVTNFISLSADEVDEAGVPRLELHWTKGPLERRTLVEGMRLFGETLAQNDLGRVRMADWVVNGEDYPEDQELAGHHHMGGTRMHDDPKKGVVDRDCKVHGMRNLYIGGSSVFTTSGQANPTTTIVALACRLGDHLSHTLSS